jgi:hypothetical protein
VSPDLPVAVLLGSTVLICVACGTHLALRVSAADRMHVIAPASVFAPALLALAIGLSDGFAQTTGKAAFAWLILAISSPLFGQALGRVLRVRGEI